MIISNARAAPDVRSNEAGVCPHRSQDGFFTTSWIVWESVTALCVMLRTAAVHVWRILKRNGSFCSPLSPDHPWFPGLSQIVQYSRTICSHRCAMNFRHSSFGWTGWSGSLLFLLWNYELVESDNWFTPCCIGSKSCGDREECECFIVDQHSVFCPDQGPEFDWIWTLNQSLDLFSSASAQAIEWLELQAI